MINCEKVSERRACELVSLSRSQFKYESSKRDDPELIRKIVEIKSNNRRYGVPRVHAVLCREGRTINRKKVYRLLQALNSLVPRRTKGRNSFSKINSTCPQANRVNDVWAMDFVFDRFADGSKFRCFTIIDVLSREVPGILASRSMAGFSPVDFLEELKGKTKLPKHFICDNGSEFANNVFVSWCKKNEINVHFIDPGKPVQNAYIESFNGKFRAEFLSEFRFKNLPALRASLAKWIIHYNEKRPHSALDYLTPKEFAIQQAA